MGVLDWLRLFDGQPWNVCVFIKGGFPVGGWKNDIAARYRFGNYLTLEHLNAEPLPPKTSRRHLGFISGLGLWWHRKRFPGFLRSVGPRKVICVSDAGRKRLIDDYRFPARKVVTVHNGIDPLRFRRDPGRPMPGGRAGASLRQP